MDGMAINVDEKEPIVILVPDWTLAQLALQISQPSDVMVDRHRAYLAGTRRSARPV